MASDFFPGFEILRLPGDGAEIHLKVGGPEDGAPILMIHGYPQTHIVWRHLAPKLAETYRVICPDLRGYGDSERPASDAAHEVYSKRSMGRDLAAVMTALGHETYSIVSHDRGARVGHRMAMDFPDRVEKLCSFDVVPTGSVWNRANKDWAMGSFHWLFLAQPTPRPETVIGHDPDYFLTWLLDSWAADMTAFDDGALEEYKRHFRDPDVIHATCEDYRAGVTIDDELDQADLAAGRKVACPVLAVWGGVRSVGGPKTDGKTSALDVWREWADNVRGGPAPCGHFIPEEAPDVALEQLLPFLAGD